MSGAEPWGPPIGLTARGPHGGPSTDAARRSFWSPTVVNSCPECRHPTDSHRLREIAVDPGGGRVTRVRARTIYEVECVVCQRQCCRTYS